MNLRDHVLSLIRDAGVFTPAPDQFADAIIARVKHYGWLRTESERELWLINCFLKANPIISEDSLRNVSQLYLPLLQVKVSHVAEDWYNFEWSDNHGFNTAYTVKLEHLPDDGPKILRSAHQRWCAWKETHAH